MRHTAFAAMAAATFMVWSPASSSASPSPGDEVTAPSIHSQGAPCKTSKKRIVKDLRAEDAIPLVRKAIPADVRACRGRWAVITVSGMGDTSFNTHYIHRRWQFNSGYPSSCSNEPAWLCPTHP